MDERACARLCTHNHTSTHKRIEDNVHSFALSLQPICSNTCMCACCLCVCTIVQSLSVRQYLFVLLNFNEPTATQIKSDTVLTDNGSFYLRSNVHIVCKLLNSVCKNPFNCQFTFFLGTFPHTNTQRDTTLFPFKFHSIFRTFLKIHKCHMKNSTKLAQNNFTKDSLFQFRCNKKAIMMETMRLQRVLGCVLIEI